MPVTVAETAEGLSGLERAVCAWVERADSRPLGRWFSAVLDAEGVPRRLPVSGWLDCLEQLAEARRRRPIGWPELFGPSIAGLLRGMLRFSRPDGAPVFGPRTPPSDAGPLLREWARQLGEPGLETVVNWWFPTRRRHHGHAAPPLPAWSDRERVLAVLRANWAADGDFVALDHRARCASSAFELFGNGRTWLGPAWTVGEPDATASVARPTCWVTTSAADLAEWTFKTGGLRIVRTALLLRGRQLALLADQAEGPAAVAEMRLAIAEGVTVEPGADTRALTLVAAGGRARARLFPIGLPVGAERTSPGGCTVKSGAVALAQPSAAKRTWLPLVVSWAPERNRRAAHWRTLTVSEKSKPCTPGTAFAARLSWGREETLVVYRSLARPGLRAFLGHQTRARFLVGFFTKEGKVEPVLQVDE